MDMQPGVVVKSDSVQLNLEGHLASSAEPHNSAGRGEKLGGRRGEKVASAIFRFSRLWSEP